jgi:hypothetical protein
MAHEYSESVQRVVLALLGKLIKDGLSSQMSLLGRHDTASSTA